MYNVHDRFSQLAILKDSIKLLQLKSQNHDNTNQGLCHDGFLYFDPYISASFHSDSDLQVLFELSNNFKLIFNYYLYYLYYL